MTETKNSVRRNFWILGIVVSLTIILVFFQTQIDSRIRNHPKVVRMERVEERAKERCDRMEKRSKEQFDSINEELKALNEKMDELLREKCP